MAITANKLLSLFSNQHLLGVNYQVKKEGEIDQYFNYTYKPMVENLTVGTIDTGEHYISAVLTIQPRTSAQDNRITGILPELQERGFVTYEGHEKVSPVTVLGTLMEEGKTNPNGFFANKRVMVSLSLADAKVSTRTIVGAPVTVVEIVDTWGDDSSILTLLFGLEDNLHGLSTYINKEFTRADLRKFLELLNSKTLSVAPLFFRVTTNDVNTVVTTVPTVLDEYPTAVIEDGAFIYSVVHSDGVLNFRDKHSVVMLKEHNGSYELTFTRKESGLQVASILLK